MTRRSFENPDETVQLNVKIAGSIVEKAHEVRTLGDGKPLSMAAYISGLIEADWRAHGLEIEEDKYTELRKRRDALVQVDQDHLEYLRALDSVFGPDDGWNATAQQEIVDRLERLGNLPIPAPIVE